MKRKLIAIVLSLYTFASFAQAPELDTWIQNTTATGYAGIVSNVQLVQYSTSNVYISCTCIPGYSIGPWSNPNVASNQNFVFSITRNPQQNTGTATAVGLGHIGVWSNGVSVFNVSDAQSYNNQGIWNRNAYYWEYPSFDNCLGHAQQQGEYHHHVSPTCLYDQADSLNHSPIIGYAFDGFPIYGAYAYTNVNGTGAIKRMQSGYVLNTATTRTNGPAVSSTYPNGCFIEDYTWVSGAGDLDERNGRFCVTPEYPAGTYAYFVTIDASLAPAFPYTFFGTYYGVVQAGNTGMGSGHVTITEATTVYTGATGVKNVTDDIKYTLAENPVKDYAFIYFDPQSANNVKAEIYDIRGQLLFSQDNMQPSISYTFDFTTYTTGTYFLYLTSANKRIVQRIIKVN